MIKNLSLWNKKAIKWGVLLGVAAAFCVAGQSLAMLENFDSYSVGTDISGIGNWATTTYPAKVSDTQSVSAPNSAFFDHPNWVRYAKLNIGTGSERLEFDVFLVACPTGSPFSFYFRDIGEGDFIGWFDSVELIDGECQIRGRKSGAYETIGTMPLDTWRTFIFEQETIAGSDYIRYSINGGVNFTTWLPAILSKRDIRIFHLLPNIFNKGYVDNITGEPAELRVWGVSPASGSIATSTDANFTIGWEGWDFEDIYKDFVFSFYEKNTEIVVGSVIYEPATSTTGTYVLPLSDFGFWKNGDYYFRAKARSPLYEYTAYYTTDLVSPEWWINLNISGWTSVFEMPDYMAWYAENSKFATSTAIFTGITTFISPIFNKIGEFGNSAVAFLDLDEAYDRGYELGKIIPIFRQYIDEIEVFFGGFPIIQIFLAFLVILLGIFIVRLILKFIPGLG